MANKVALDAETRKLRQRASFVGGGIIAISIIILQDFISAPSLDIPSLISVLSLSVSMPFLAATILVYQIEIVDDYYIKTIWEMIIVGFGFGIGLLAGIIGIIAAVWHIFWVAGVIFSSVTFILLVVEFLHVVVSVLNKLE